MFWKIQGDAIQGCIRRPKFTAWDLRSTPKKGVQCPSKSIFCARTNKEDMRPYLPDGNEPDHQHLDRTCPADYVGSEGSFTPVDGPCEGPGF
jgi:hypothetical protein